MRNLRLTIEYDGTDFAGWQVQAVGRTVQGELERAIERITGNRATVYGAGRTDAGVHAAGQVASFRSDTALEPGRLLRALEATTPHDIAILAVEDADPSFHARRSATGKHYSYALQGGWPRPALDRRRVAAVWGRLDHAAMRLAAEVLVGRHDFAAFQGANSPRATTERTLARCELVPDARLPNRLVVHLEADGFLYKMCRAIVGTLVEVGRGALTVDAVRALLQDPAGQKAGFTAPAHGLTLERVFYSSAPGGPSTP